MQVILVYDIKTQEDNTRIRKVHNICTNYGIQIQNSVFIFDINTAELNNIITKLKEIISSDDNIIYFKAAEIKSLNTNILKDYKHDLLLY